MDGYYTRAQEHALYFELLLKFRNTGVLFSFDPTSLSLIKLRYNVRKLGFHSMFLYS